MNSAMSAIGTKRTSRVALHMSAFGVKRTLAHRSIDACRAYDRAGVALRFSANDKASVRNNKRMMRCISPSNDKRSVSLGR